MSDRKRHPSANIPAALVEDINFRAYLSRLEPPLTVEQSREQTYTAPNNKGRPVTTNDASRRAAAVGQMSLTRDYLRVLVDLGLIARCWPDETEERAA